MTDGHKAVIGPHCQEKDVQLYKEKEIIHLVDAAFIGHNFALVLEVLQHLMDGGGGEIDVYKGQVEEEEIHGVVEVVV